MAFCHLIISVRFLALFTFTIVFHKTESRCPQDWQEFQGACYNVSSHGLTWEGAKKACQNLTADLVSITNSGENLFITNQLAECKNESCPHWLGLTRQDPAQDANLVERRAGWSWLDGKVYTYNNWAFTEGAEEPSWGSSRALILSTGTWAGNDGDDQLGYICKRKALPRFDQSIIVIAVFLVVVVLAAAGIGLFFFLKRRRNILSKDEVTDSDTGEKISEPRTENHQMVDDDGSEKIADGPYENVTEEKEEPDLCAEIKHDLRTCNSEA